jgi:hypothetical protein
MVVISVERLSVVRALILFLSLLFLVSCADSSVVGSKYYLVDLGNESVSGGGSSFEPNIYYAYRTTEFDATAGDVWYLIDLETQVVNDDAYSENAGVVTILESGLYKFGLDCVVDIDAGTRDDAQCALEINGTLTSETFCSTYAREVARIGTSCSRSGFLNLGVNATVELVYRPDTAGIDLGGGIIVTYPVSLYLEKIR